MLALTDQFPEGAHARAAAEAEKNVWRASPTTTSGITISGIIRERRGKAVLRSDRPGSGRSAQEWLREAMACYERPKRSGPQTTTKRCCGGIPARAS